MKLRLPPGMPILQNAVYYWVAELIPSDAVVCFRCSTVAAHTAGDDDAKYRFRDTHKTCAPVKILTCWLCRGEVGTPGLCDECRESARDEIRQRAARLPGPKRLRVRGNSYSLRPR